MWVKASKMGYYEHKRIKEGEEFQIDDRFVKLDETGRVIAPKWIEMIEAAPKASKNKVAKEVIDQEADVI